LLFFLFPPPSYLILFKEKKESEDPSLTFSQNEESVLAQSENPAQDKDPTNSDNPTLSNDPPQAETEDPTLEDPSKAGDPAQAEDPTVTEPVEPVSI